MSLYQSLLCSLIELCDDFGMDWHWLDDGSGIQVDLTSTDEFSRHRFLKETKKLREDIFNRYR